MSIIGTEKTDGVKAINYLVWFRFSKAYIDRDKFVQCVKEVGLDEFLVPRLMKKPQALRKVLRNTFSGKELITSQGTAKLTMIESSNEPEFKFHINGTVIDYYQHTSTTRKLVGLTYNDLSAKTEIEFEKIPDDEKLLLEGMFKGIDEKVETLITNLTNEQIADYVTYYLENTVRFRASAALYYVHPKYKELLEKLKTLVDKVNGIAVQELAKMEFNYITLIDPRTVANGIVGSVQDEAECLQKEIDNPEPMTAERGQKILQRVHSLRQRAKASEEFFRNQQEQVWNMLNELDTSASKAVSEALQKGDIDDLTQLYTRSRFIQLVHNLLATNPDAKWSIAMADIDFFKKINDTYGHQFGDRCLKIVANTIKSKLQEPDIAGRYGGEEFILFFLKPADSSRDDCEEIRKAIASLGPRVVESLGQDPKTLRHYDAKTHLTVSIGIAEGGKGIGLEAVIREADKLLYKAKNSGRNKAESKGK
ncbi:MAG: GGDEF domain-containing protein [Elusimicrobiota bacterium]